MDNDQNNQNNSHNNSIDDPEQTSTENDIHENQTNQSQPPENQSDYTRHIEQHAASVEHAPHKQSRKKRSGLGSGFIGGIFGGLVATALILLLVVNNIIPGISLAENNSDAKSTQTVSNDTSNEPNIVNTVDDGSEEATNVEEASDAVVGVVNLQQQDIWTESEKAGTGSGIIYKKQDGKGYVVTNDHVVADAEEVEVVLNDDKHINAKVLGTDELTDLAVLEIDGDKIDTVAKIGSSGKLKVGETVLAIGNPLGMEFANSLTKGIVSGLNRSLGMDTTGNRQQDWTSEVIQTDAAVNPGNSGGALVNSNGEVVGINSMKIAQQTVEGMSFAIPIDTALPIMEQLETDGQVARPFIGISMVPLNQVPAQYRDNINLPEEQEDGVVVAQVEPGSPAAKADLKQFDVITKIDGEEIANVVDLRKLLYGDTNIGDTVKLEINRNGEQQTAQLKLVERESE